MLADSKYFEFEEMIFEASETSCHFHLSVFKFSNVSVENNKVDRLDANTVSEKISVTKDYAGTCHQIFRR